MSVVVPPAFAAAEVDALLTEWALKISVFTPAFLSTDVNHLAMVAEVTGFYMWFD